MTQHIDTLRVFYSMLSNMELVALRHDAIRLEDLVTKELIDKEFKKRLNNATNTNTKE